MVSGSEDRKVGVVGALLVLGLCTALAPSLHATTVFFSGSGQAGPGSTLSFSSGGFTVTASAWALTGSNGPGGTPTFQQATLGQYSGGLGVCNSTETNCVSPNHAVDNSGPVDFVLLQFSQVVTAVQLVLNPFGNNFDMDITYFAGNCTGVCTPANLRGTGASSFNGKEATNNTTLYNLFPTGKFEGPINSLTNPSTSMRTVYLDLSGVSGGVNFVMVGATTLGGYTGNDYFKIYSLGVPEPATFGLAGAALLAMGVFRATRKRAKT